MLFATLETIRKLGWVKISGIIIYRGSAGQIGQFFFTLCPVSVPEVFEKVNSAQSPSRFESGECEH